MSECVGANECLQSLRMMDDELSAELLLLLLLCVVDGDGDDNQLGISSVSFHPLTVFSSVAHCVTFHVLFPRSGIVFFLVVVFFSVTCILLS